jgi:hypothetical protein
MSKELRSTIAAWLWKYYEYGLPDSPGRMATGLVAHLQAEGFSITDQEGPPACTCEVKPCECEEEWFKKQN